MGANFIDQLQEFRRWIAFDIEFGRIVLPMIEKLAEFVNIGATDVPFIGSWMHRNAMRSSCDHYFCGFDNAWITYIALISQ